MNIFMTNVEIIVIRLVGVCNEDPEYQYILFPSKFKYF